MMYKIFALLLIIVAVDAFGLKKQNLKVKATKIEKCASTNAIPVYVHIKELPNENTYSGNATLPYDITDKMTLQVDVSKQRSDGTWEDNVINFKKNDPCMIFNTFLGEVWYKEQDRLKMPRGQCPIKKGTYHDEDVRIDLEDLTIPGFLAGKLKVKVQGIQDGKVELCILANVEVY